MLDAIGHVSAFVIHFEQYTDLIIIMNVTCSFTRIITIAFFQLIDQSSTIPRRIFVFQRDAVVKSTVTVGKEAGNQ